MVKLNKELSDIPSELLTQALEDLKLCEQNPKVKINMRYWFKRKDNICNVCLAGAVMYNNIDLNRLYLYLWPDDFGKSKNKLRSLYWFGVGYIGKGLEILNKYPKYDKISDLVEIKSYHEDKEQFYKDMYRLVNDLKEIGL